MISEQTLKDRLQTIAKEKGIPFNACWKQLLLERFLVRLGRSPYASKLIFKGGFLLAYMMKIGRETIDLDFLLTRMKVEAPLLQKICEEIAEIPCNDGFSFSFAKIESLSQPHMNYPGYRITLNASFAKMRDKTLVDIGIGDAVHPQQFEIKLFQYKGKPFFEEAVSLLVYPTETIFAEKLETVLSKGSRNSRMKDYHDLFLLTRAKMMNAATLKNAVSETFSNRETPLTKIQFDPNEIQVLQKLWTAHLLGLGDVAEDLKLPKDIRTVIEEINENVSLIKSYENQ